MSKGQQILEAAVRLAESGGLHGVTRDGVALEAQVSTALVNRYWGTIARLKDEVVVVAVRRENLRIVAEALLCQHPVALAAPRRVQQRAAQYVATPRS